MVRLAGLCAALTLLGCQSGAVTQVFVSVEVEATAVPGSIDAVTIAVRSPGGAIFIETPTLYFCPRAIPGALCHSSPITITLTTNEG